MTNTDTTRASGSSAERSLRLLSTLAQQGKGMSLAQLADELQLPKATAHRLTTQLLDVGFIAKSQDNRVFEIGPAMRQMALDTLNHDTARGLRHAVLSDVVNQVGETCNFTTLDGAGVMYLDRVEASWPWRLTLDVGVHVPIHCTASGKLFLAHMPKATRHAMLQTLTLERMTEHTITTVDALQQECATIAKQGYAFDRQEFIPGLIALAVPVHDANNNLRGAIAVHAPVARLTTDSAAKHLPALKRAAKRMGQLL
ncbi:IclR family transcriptional regulator [Comamonadaceae bacterium M7527]|nr:IclR family transcriptional regulator [Comamonadaceae bacterium M7527]